MTSTDELCDLLTRTEGLRSELEGHLRPGGPSGMMIHHPLVVYPVFGRDKFAYVNHLYGIRKQLVDQLKQEGDWYRFVFAHETAYLLDVFGNAARHMSDDEYWEILGNVYTHSEDLWDQRKKVARLLSADRDQRHTIMNGRERNHLKKQSAKLTIYRGYGFRNERGWSWTLDKSKAKWFARRAEARHGGRPKVAMAEVRKSDVIAYFSRRLEREILVDPANVTITGRIAA